MTTTPSLHTQAADMLERYGRVNGVMHCEVSMLIAELRAAAALDELVRENERLGLYDDQKPAQETKCACSPDMYVAGYTGGAAPEGLFGKLYVYIEGASRSVEYAPVAAPAPAQPVTDAQPVAWRYRDYVSGCWFVSAEPYPAGSIAGESMPLYLAPAPAQPLSDEQIERHTLRAGDCPPDSAVILVSTIKRFAERAITGEKP